MRTHTLLYPALLALACAAPAAAITLADLAAGDSITSTDGSITFSDFQVRVTGKGLRRNLARYEVIATDEGFRLKGKARSGRKGKIFLSYTVAGAELVAPTTRIRVKRGGKGRMSVSMPSGAGPLSASSSGGAFAVDQKVTLRRANRKRSFRSDVRFEQSAVVPEPGITMLGLVALAGLGLTRRRTS